MPFATGDTLSNSDTNNFLRGLRRDNTTYTVTGTLTETDMASFAMSGGTMDTAGAIWVFAAGTITNSGGGQKDVRLYFGGTAIGTVTRTGANAQDWSLIAKISNTATNAQRIEVWYITTDALTVSFDYTTLAIDTTASVTVKVTGDLANTADTITQTKFEIFVVQIA